jgi:hypothetical protein
VVAGVKIVDEFGAGFGWLAEDERLLRTSHALVVDGKVWLVDPVDAPEVESRVRALGQPVGVLQLLDRHARDCALWAARLGVPHVLAFEGSPETPFELLPVRRHRPWRESALWWPGERVLVVADALGTVGYFLAPGDRVGVHPLLRLMSPRSLRRLSPERILVGHGEGVHEDAAAALAQALSTARRRAAAVALAPLRARRRRG